MNDLSPSKKNKRLFGCSVPLGLRCWRARRDSPRGPSPITWKRGCRPATGTTTTWNGSPASLPTFPTGEPSSFITTGPTRIPTAGSRAGARVSLMSSSGGRCGVTGRLIQPPKHNGRIGSQGLPPSPDHPREKGNAYLILRNYSIGTLEGGGSHDSIAHLSACDHNHYLSFRSIAGLRKDILEPKGTVGQAPLF
jgi:hypothetical protein